MRNSIEGVQVRYSRAVFALTVIVLLAAVPVHYRGGAALSHPHALFQIWADGGHGLIHHASVLNGHAASIPAADRANVDPPSVFVAAPHGSPALTALTVFAEKAAAIGMMVLAVLLLLVGRSDLPGTTADRLVGVTCRPLHPPPRWTPSHP